MGALNYNQAQTFDGHHSVGIAVFQLPGTNALDVADRVKRKMAELKKRFPEGIDYQIAYDTTPFIRESVADVVKTLFEAVAPGRPGGAGLPAELAERADPHDRRARGHRRHLRRHGGGGLQPEQHLAVRAGAGDRHRGGRRDRGRGERRSLAGTRPAAARGRAEGHDGGHRPDHRRGAGALRRVRALRVHQRHHRPVLPAVRRDDRRFHGLLGHQLADAQPGPGRDPAAEEERARRTACRRARSKASAERSRPCWRAPVSLPLGLFSRGFNAAFGRTTAALCLERGETAARERRGPAGLCGAAGVDLQDVPPGPARASSRSRTKAGSSPAFNCPTPPRCSARGKLLAADRQDRPSRTTRAWRAHHHRGRLFLRAAGQRLELRLDVHHPRSVRQAAQPRAERYGDHGPPPPGMGPADQGRAGPRLRGAAGPGPERRRRLQAHGRGPQRPGPADPGTADRRPGRKAGEGAGAGGRLHASSAPTPRSSSWTSTGPRWPPWAFPSAT